MSGKGDKPDKPDTRRLIHERDVAALLGTTVGLLRYAQMAVPGMPRRRGARERRYYDRDEILIFLAQRMAPCIKGPMPVPMRDMSNPDTLLTTTEAAAYLGVKLGKLQSDRQRSYEFGKPPVLPFFRLPDNRIRYRLGDLLAIKAKES